VLGLHAGRGALHLVRPDLLRSIGVWCHLLPIFGRYVWTKRRCDAGVRRGRLTQQQVDARWAARHEAGGKQVATMIHKVRSEIW
jgi:hypothetical protein